MSGEVREFTPQIPFWRPRVSPLPIASASEEQLEAMKMTPGGGGVTEYVRVLALDPKLLRERTPLFNGIMYGRGGLSRAERELSALAASVVNRCIYCAAVHAHVYNELTKTQSVSEALFAQGEQADLDPRQSAIVRFASRLSVCPSEASKEDVVRLVEVGFGHEEIFDVVLSASVFGWANRLMHTLGDPVELET